MPQSPWAPFFNGSELESWERAPYTRASGWGVLRVPRKTQRGPNFCRWEKGRNCTGEGGLHGAPTLEAHAVQEAPWTCASAYPLHLCLPGVDPGLREGLDPGGCGARPGQGQACHKSLGGRAPLQPVLLSRLSSLWLLLERPGLAPGSLPRASLRGALRGTWACRFRDAAGAEWCPLEDVSTQLLLASPVREGEWSLATPRSGSQCPGGWEASKQLQEEGFRASCSCRSSGPAP